MFIKKMFLILSFLCVFILPQFANSQSSDKVSNDTIKADSTRSTAINNISQENQEKCFPPCRSGYFCKNGNCISLCNPPCPPDMVCSKDTQCISLKNEAQSPSNYGQIRYSIDDKRNFQLKRIRGKIYTFTGIGLIFVGSLSDVLFPMHNAQGQQEPSAPGIVMELIGVPSLIAGIVTWVRGKRGLEAIQYGHLPN